MEKNKFHVDFCWCETSLLQCSIFCGWEANYCNSCVETTNFQNLKPSAVPTPSSVSIFLSLCLREIDRETVNKTETADLIKAQKPTVVVICLSTCNFPSSSWVLLPSIQLPNFLSFSFRPLSVATDRKGFNCFRNSLSNIYYVMPTPWHSYCNVGDGVGGWEIM